MNIFDFFFVAVRFHVWCLLISQQWKCDYPQRQGKLFECEGCVVARLFWVLGWSIVIHICKRWYYHSLTTPSRGISHRDCLVNTEDLLKLLWLPWNLPEKSDWSFKDPKVSDDGDPSYRSRLKSFPNCKNWKSLAAKQGGKTESAVLNRQISQNWHNLYNFATHRPAIGKTWEENMQK